MQNHLNHGDHLTHHQDIMATALLLHQSLGHLHDTQENSCVTNMGSAFVISNCAEKQHNNGPGST